MSYQFQPRYENGIYRDCKWCQGRGCVYCPGEAEAEYNRQFPSGPEPILTITTEQMEKPEVIEALKSLIGPAAIMAAKNQGKKKAKELFKQFPGLVEIPSGMSEDQAATIAGNDLVGAIIVENIEKSDIKKLLK